MFFSCLAMILWIWIVYCGTVLKFEFIVVPSDSIFIRWKNCSFRDAQFSICCRWIKLKLVVDWCPSPSFSLLSLFHLVFWVFCCTRRATLSWTDRVAMNLMRNQVFYKQDLKRGSSVIQSIVAYGLILKQTWWDVGLYHDLYHRFFNTPFHSTATKKLLWVILLEHQIISFISRISIWWTRPFW
jgi:hypothetical protein